MDADWVGLTKFQTPTLPRNWTEDFAITGSQSLHHDHHPIFIIYMSITFIVVG